MPIPYNHLTDYEFIRYATLEPQGSAVRRLAERYNDNREDVEDIDRQLGEALEEIEMKDEQIKKLESQLDMALLK